MSMDNLKDRDCQRYILALQTNLHAEDNCKRRSSYNHNLQIQPQTFMRASTIRGSIVMNCNVSEDVLGLSV